MLVCAVQVMIPSGQVAKAEQLIKEHSHHLQKDSEAVCSPFYPLQMERGCEWHV